MGGPAAAALVFGSSAAVLVVELVALRLLAPYLGLTLETNTVVIGVALTAIAVGSWWGGRLADLVPARRLIGPLLLVSGVTVAATPFLVRLAAESADGSMLLLAAGLTLFVPGALLSAVTPAVTKLRLSSIAETGTVVGRLSGIGTAGAVVGTVVTGFVLVSRVPVTGIMVGLGLALVVAAVAVEARLRLVRGAAGASLVLVALGGLGGAVGPGGCDAETTYHCVVVEQDPERESGRVLVLDGLRHSYVDLDDATHLEFAYVQAIASAVDTALPGQEAVDAYHLGAGALTVPRYLDAVRPGSSSLVSEIDAGRRGRRRLARGRGPVAGHRGARRGRPPRASAGSGTTPATWSWATPSAGSARRGTSPPARPSPRWTGCCATTGCTSPTSSTTGRSAFARAELATLASTFDHVALAADADTVGRTAAAGGNLVALASDRPLDTAAWQDRLDERGTDWRVITGRDLRAWVDGAGCSPTSSPPSTSC